MLFHIHGYNIHFIIQDNKHGVFTNRFPDPINSGHSPLGFNSFFPPFSANEGDEIAHHSN